MIITNKEKYMKNYYDPVIHKMFLVYIPEKYLIKPLADFIFMITPNWVICDLLYIYKIRRLFNSDNIYIVFKIFLIFGSISY